MAAVNAVSLLAALPLAVLAASGSDVVGKVPVQGTPCGVAGAAGAVWVTEATFGKLLRIDPAKGAVVKTVATDPTPCELKLAAESLWVVTQSGRLDRFDPATGKKLASIPVGATTYDLTYALGSIWVTNRNGGTVQRVSPRTNKVLKTIAFPRGSLPAGIGYAAGALWVGDDHGSFVTRIDPRTFKLTRVRSGGAGASWIAAARPERLGLEHEVGLGLTDRCLRSEARLDREGRRQPGQPRGGRRRRLGAR